MENLKQDNGHKEFRLWKFIEFEDVWHKADTSNIDDISPSWFKHREKLKENSKEYRQFIDEQKREHAIETGIVERLYDLKRGITETFIKEGFVQSYLSHGDTNVPTQTLMNHLRDHLDAVDFVFDIVKENRPFTTNFIKQLHQLVTRHQETAEGRDAFGNKTKIDLLRGMYKIRENNPTRSDGVVIQYCPPEHVAAEMDSLITIYNQLIINQIHPIVLSAWVHHAFTTIHPFQDGNGRVARLLASLILIKFNYFPFTVLREETRVKYIDALELADNGVPQKLITYFGETQRRSIEKVLNINDINISSLDEVADVISKKLEIKSQNQQGKYDSILSENRIQIFNNSLEILEKYKTNLKARFNGGVELKIEKVGFDESEKQRFYNRLITEYAKTHHYHFNRNLPKGWINFVISLSDTKVYHLGISLHHFGYEDSTLAISAFLELKGDSKRKDDEDIIIPIGIPPYVISIDGEIEEMKVANISAYLEKVLTLTFAQIASEL
jgi:Fic family protein